MTNMQAAVGLAQLERLDEIISIRKQQMDLYYTLLADCPQVKLRSYAEWCTSVHWLLTITLPDGYDRDKFLAYMSSKGVECRQMINPVHEAKYLIDHYDSRNFPNSIKVSAQSAHLPSSTSLTEEQVKFICDTVKSFFL
jgi:perosamine synthetase